MRAARADVDLTAVAHNVDALRRAVAPALLCAVVKADGYGHGAIAVSEAAIAAGADWLAVALVEEGAVLRKAGIQAPILLLSQPRLADLAAVVRYDLRVTIHSSMAAELLAVAAHDQGKVARVHLKVDTGMNRVGVAPEDALAVALRDRAPARARARGRVHPLRRGRRARQPVHRRAARPVRGVLDQLADAGIPRPCATRPTRPPPSSTPAAATTSCGPASRSTASPRSRAGRRAHLRPR